MPKNQRSAPVYLQLARGLQRRIDAGELPAGTRLPSEPELSAEFGVNRLTVRQAMAELERAASIEVRRGVGTFVRPPVTRVSITVDPRSQRVDIGSTQSVPLDGGPGREPDFDGERIVAVRPGPSGRHDQEAAAHLRRPADELSRVDTVFLQGSSAWVVNSYWLLTARLPPGLGPSDGSGNVVRRLSEAMGITLEYDWRAFSAVGADVDDADALGVPTGSPLLVREGVSCDATGAPMLYVRRRIRGESARFVLRFRDGAETGPCP
ncbi:GntR family transcriptional regulator [Streptomyces sp. NPDC012600]|uniref:GntR family transcriptional regulator n=1 Tax=Streptomyces sp. NPDC012600 TaxID=3415005 RepID=UPI003C2CA137